MFDSILVPTDRPHAPRVARRGVDKARRIAERLVGSSFAAALLLGSSVYAADNDGRVPDASRGRVLYEKHCTVCHGPGMHARRDRIPATRDELRMLVDHFRRQANVGLTRDEIDDIVEHLNIMQYRFPPEKQAPAR